MHWPCKLESVISICHWYHIYLQIVYTLAAMSNFHGALLEWGLVATVLKGPDSSHL